MRSESMVSLRTATWCSLCRHLPSQLDEYSSQRLDKRFNEHSHQSRHPSPILVACLCAILAMTILSSSVLAQSEPKTLTLEEAWRIALSNNLTLKQQEILLSQSREELAILKAQRLPNLSASGAYGYTSDVVTLEVPITLPSMAPIQIEAGTKERYDAAATLEQPIFTGFRTSNLIKSASEQFRAQSAQKEIVTSQILLQVGILYCEVQLNDLQQAVLKQAIGRADHHLTKVRSYYHAKQATAFDTLEVANRKLQLTSQLQKLRDLKPVLISKLAHLLNIDFTPDIPAADIDDIDLILGDLDQYQIVAIAHRPELKQMGYLLRGQSFRIGALKSAYFPQLYASASYHYARPGVDFFRDEWTDYYTIGLTLRWQFWNWMQDQRQVSKARLDYDRLDFQSQQLLQDVRQQVTEAYQQLVALRRQIELQRELVRQEGERYRITKENYEQGFATTLDLSTAENTLTSAELTLKQNHVEWLQQELQLEFAMGTIGQ